MIIRRVRRLVRVWEPSRHLKAPRTPCQCVLGGRDASIVGSTDQGGEAFPTLAGIDWWSATEEGPLPPRSTRDGTEGLRCRGGSHTLTRRRTRRIILAIDVPHPSRPRGAAPEAQQCPIPPPEARVIIYTELINGIVLLK